MKATYKQQSHSTLNEVGAKKTKVKSNKRKFGYLASITMVTGSVIGGGVFVKTGQIAGTVGSDALVYSAWAIGGIGIILMGLALIEIFRGCGADNKGIVGWAEKFMGPFGARLARIFMSFFYFPINYLVLPYYTAYLFYNAFGLDFYNVGDVPIWEQLIVTIGIMLFFILMNGLSTYLGKLTQISTMFLKMIPIIALMIIAMFLTTYNYDIDVDGQMLNANEELQTVYSNASSANGAIALVVALPSVLFAYDGFYESGSITENMIKPKKRYPIVLIVGLSFIIAVYVLISFAIIAGGGSPLSIVKHVFGENTEAGKALTITIGFLIGVSVAGVMNGFSVGVPRFYESEIKANRLPFAKSLKPKVEKWNDKIGSPLIGSLYSIILTIPWYIIWITIGIYGFKDFPTFNDVVADWLSLLVFVLIAFILIAAIVNRRTKKVNVTKTKYFLPAAIIGSLIFITIAITNLVVKVEGVIDGSVYDSWSLACVCIMIFLTLFFSALGHFNFRSYTKTNSMMSSFLKSIGHYNFQKRRISRRNSTSRRRK